MDGAETNGLLREIRDLLAGQEQLLERHVARIRELDELSCARVEQLYRDQLQQANRQNRTWMFANYLYLFVTVFVAAAIGAHWGR